MEITKKDIIYVLNEFMEDDIPGWDLDPDPSRGLDGEQRKEWYIKCVKEAIKIVESNG